MRLVEELADDDARLPSWYVGSRYLGVGKLQFEDSPLTCFCRHVVGAHYEMWPAYQRVTGDASYQYVKGRPVRQGCDECKDCGGLRIDMDDQANVATLVNA